MWTGNWELLVCWESGETSRYLYSSEDAAYRGAKNFVLAFGNQIQWYGVSREVSK